MLNEHQSPGLGSFGKTKCSLTPSFRAFSIVEKHFEKVCVHLSIHPNMDGYVGVGGGVVGENREEG
jgi:hypothetical protein